MPLGALLYPLGLKCALPPKACAPLPSVCIPWGLLYVLWGLIYVPWGTFMPLEALLCPLRLKCVPSKAQVHALLHACALPLVCAPFLSRVRLPPRHTCFPLAVCTPVPSIRASFSSIRAPLSSRLCPLAVVCTFLSPMYASYTPLKCWHGNPPYVCLCHVNLLY
jgi:hypothetical protein